MLAALVTSAVRLYGFSETQAGNPRTLPGPAVRPNCRDVLMISEVEFDRASFHDVHTRRKIPFLEQVRTGIGVHGFGDHSQRHQHLLRDGEGLNARICFLCHIV